MKMLVGDTWRDASDGKMINVMNPATGELVDTIPAATQEDVELAIASAVEGQREWGSYPLFKRAEILRRFSGMIDGHTEELAQLYTRETGKSITESRKDFWIVKALFNAFVETANNLLGDAMPIGVQTGREHDFEVTIREPLGVVACIIPFNAPTVLFTHKVAPALIAGNAVIVKPASDDPLVLLKLGELLVEAGVPAKAVQFVTGSGSKVGNWLTSDPRIAKVSFTGSTEVGMDVARKAIDHLAYLSLELGGNAPFVIMEDADIDDAVAEAVSGRAAYLAGQICNCAKRFIVHRSRKEEFVTKLVAALKQLKMGDPMDPETQVGCLISEKAAIEVEKQVNMTIAQGAKLILGGKRSGAFYEPTVLDEVTTDMDVAHDLEIFGPVFPIMVFDTFEEAVEIGNATQYGLGAGIMTKDMKVALRFARQIQAGSVIINGQSGYRSLLMPFGGYKKSGYGREGLTATLQAVTQTKSIVFKNMLD